MKKVPKAVLQYVSTISDHPVTIPFLYVFWANGKLLKCCLCGIQMCWLIQLNHFQHPQISIGLLMTSDDLWGGSAFVNAGTFEKRASGIVKRTL